MTIRERLTLIALLCLGIVVVAGTGLTLAELEHRKAVDAQERIAATQDRISLLNTLTSDCLLFLNDRAKQQWHLVDAELQQELAELPSHVGQDNEALISLRKNHTKLSQLFSHLCGIVDVGTAEEGESEAARALRDEMSAQLHLLSENMREQINRLAQEA